MNNIIMLFTVYFLAANIVAGAIFVFGQKKAGLLWYEYPFIYVPWLAMMLMFDNFSSLPGVGGTDLSLKYFLLLVQGFSCGIMGGAILLARFFVRAQSVVEKLTVTVSSSLIMGVVYLISRFLLLEMIRWVLSMRS